MLGKSSSTLKTLAREINSTFKTADTPSKRRPASVWTMASNGLSVLAYDVEPNCPWALANTPRITETHGAETPDFFFGLKSSPRHSWTEFFF